MTPAAKHKLIVERIHYWKDRLNIDPRTKICVSFKNPEEDSKTAAAYASVCIEELGYHRVHLTIYPSTLEVEDFKKDIDAIICHEMIHVLMGELMSYVAYKVESSEEDYLTQLEERLVCCLEKAFCGENAVNLDNRGIQKKGHKVVE